jgi:hypothetical protein
LSVPLFADKLVTINIYHPPKLAAALNGRRAIVGTLAGRCSAEFAALLERDLGAYNLAPVGAAERDGALERAGLSGATDPAQPAAAAALVRALGPLIAFTAQIDRCDVRQREPLLGPGMPAIHISRSEGHFDATLRAIDLESGRELGAATLRAVAQKENQSQTGNPEYPGNLEVQSLTLLQALGQARQLYAPWKESRDVPFVDDKSCGLQQAYGLLKSGDSAALQQTLRQSATTCTGSPKLQASVYYDLAVAYLADRKMKEAAEALDRSRQIYPSRQAEQLLASCQDALALARAASATPLSGPPPDPAASGNEPALILTNDFILKLLHGGIDEQQVLAMIANNSGRYLLDDASLAALKQAGASEAILDAMRRKK